MRDTMRVLIACAAASGCGADSRSLAETGLYDDFATRTIAADVVPFQPQFELWSDGAIKQRYLYLPAGTQIDTSDLDTWIYPVGTKLWKEFRRDGVLVETRLLEKLGPDEWDTVAFAWSADGREAFAVPDGRRDVLDTQHDIPAQKECRGCHRVVDRVLGATALQLDHDLGGLDLATLASTGRLSHPPASRLVVPGDDATRAALGYLHGNCGGCHNALAENPLRLWLGTSELASVDTTPTYRTAVGAMTQAEYPLAGADATTIVAPGDPQASLLYLRMTRRGDGGMSPLGTELVDEVGSQLVATWIESL